MRTTFCTMARRSSATAGAAIAAIVILTSAACTPVVSRGGAGTTNPGLDEAPMSTKLDKKDLDYLVEQNLTALYGSSFWMHDVVPGSKPLVTIFPIRNDTSEHLNDEMNTLLSSIETSLVNSGEVNVVSRERQAQMIAEVGYQQGAAMDPATAAKIGRQLGAKYYVTGKLGAVDERMQSTRRVQYTLFIQVIDVETSLIKFQHEAARSKAIKG
jgi:PBP1b-binding outer membrane lipoprotein LpoB